MLSGRFIAYDDIPLQLSKCTKKQCSIIQTSDGSKSLFIIDHGIAAGQKAQCINIGGSTVSYVFTYKERENEYMKRGQV